MSFREDNSHKSHERYLEQNETSTIHKMKETYWTTKQAVIKKLGKKEDVHVVASDHELDGKLGVFKAVQKSCMDLLRVIERYQDRLCVVAQEENAMGRYLKSQASVDKTRAGKMMAAVGKSQSFAAQQRLALRVPLIRLYQEVETFRYRAISDTLMTINRMESARTEYRGALLWMKNVSEELDPDTYKQLEKFRKVQAQVRKTKSRFDRLKLDVMQKVDLLAASRCNMFSHVLANYQTALLQFWQKTSRTMTAVSESFKGYQYYEFNLLKDLVEPSKKLAEETAHSSDTDIAALDDFDPEKLMLDMAREETKKKMDDVFDHEEPVTSARRRNDSDDELITEHDLDDLDDFVLAPSNHVAANDGGRLIEFEEEADFDEKLLNDPDLSLPKRRVEQENGKNEEGVGEDEELLKNLRIRGEGDGMMHSGHPHKKGDFLLGDAGSDAACDPGDDLSALIEILNCHEEDEEAEFSKEWQDVFGPSSTMSASESADFMPSSLLELGSKMTQPAQTTTPAPLVPDNVRPLLPTDMPPMSALEKARKVPHKKSQKSDMSAWFNLFADLDPLSNPDAVGKKPEDILDAA